MYTQLSVTVLPRNGASLITTAGDVANGNSFVCNTDLLCSFFSASGGTVTVHNATYLDGDSSTGIHVSDRVLTLPVATPFLWVCPANIYNQSDGMVHIDYGQTTSVSIYQI
jgi:hypothetical protein